MDIRKKKLSIYTLYPTFSVTVEVAHSLPLCKYTVKLHIHLVIFYSIPSVFLQYPAYNNDFTFEAHNDFTFTWTEYLAISLSNI